MSSPHAKQTAKIIEGVVALCLGSADRVVWVDQADAAAFNDGQRLFLPVPTGQDEREYKLLLAMAFREVAKLQSCDSAKMASIAGELHACAGVLEDVRIKHVLGKEYLGTPAIFEEAAAIACDLLLSPDAAPLNPQSAVFMAVWGEAHAAMLGSDLARSTAQSLRANAEHGSDSQAIGAALTLAARAHLCDSTHEVVSLANDVLTALKLPEQKQEPQPEQQQEPGQQDEQSSAQGGEPQKADDAPTEGSNGAEGQDEPGQQHEQSGEQGDVPQEADDAANEGSSDAEGQDEPGQQDEQPSMQGDDPQGVDDAAAEGSSGASGQGHPGDESEGSDAGAEPGSVGDSSAEAGGQGEDGANGQSESTGQGGNPGEVGDSQGAPASSPDPLSEALARARGFDKARDVSEQASELGRVAKAAQEGGGEGAPDSEVLAAIREALNDPNNASAALEEVAMGHPGEITGQAEAGAALQSEVAAIEASAEDGAAELTQASAQWGGNELRGETYGAQDHRLSGIQSRLVTVMLRELQDKRRRPFQRGATGSRVATSHLWKLKALGDPRVFRKKTPVAGVDCAVAILLDSSGSMQDRMEPAVDVTYALALALQRIQGTQIAIDVFPGGHYQASHELLAFKENLHGARERLRAVEAGGGTPTGSALAARLPKLRAAKREKNHVWLITDGWPDPHEAVMAAGLIREMEAEGIDVFGIGIQANLSHLVPRSVTVSSVEELAGAIERLFKSEVVQRLAA
jgi:von Willebrand factor type A domain-containing protein